MNSFNFSSEEKIIIEECVKKGHKGWEDSRLDTLKSRLKEHFKTKQKNVCCYCSKNIYNEFNMVLDIEHILPKHKYTNHMFSIENLALSCKRCNMNIKGKRTDFLAASFLSSKSPFEKENYLFIHPNSDVFKDHLQYIHKQHDDEVIVFYRVKNESKKGFFSYNYFKLEMLEINSFNKAQGIETPNEQINAPCIDIDKAIDKAIEEYEQK